MHNLQIVPLKANDIDQCESILRALPNWFGIEESIVEYVRDLHSLDGFVAKIAGHVVGFVGLKRYGERSVEINIIGVHPNFRNQGIGSKLLNEVEQAETGTTTKLLHVKTLGPTHLDPHYVETRQFYEAKGFIPLEENALWGDVNP
ncbi:MAG: GNAT family N-acetyltransferase, partial [Chloroflexota bacterium]